MPTIGVIYCSFSSSTQSPADTASHCVTLLYWLGFLRHSKWIQFRFQSASNLILTDDCCHFAVTVSRRSKWTLRWKRPTANTTTSSSSEQVKQKKTKKKCGQASKLTCRRPIKMNKSIDDDNNNNGNRKMQITGKWSKPFERRTSRWSSKKSKCSPSRYPSPIW